MSWDGVGRAQKQEVSTGSHGRVMHTCSRNWQCALRSRACRRAEGLVSRTAERRVEKREQSVPVSDSVAQAWGPCQCQSRRKTTGQAVQTGGSRRTSRCQTDPPRSGLGGGVMGARPACLLHSIAPAKIGRAHAQQSAPGTAAVTDGLQMLNRNTEPETEREAESRDTGWNNLSSSSRRALVGRRRAGALVHRQSAAVCPLHLAADGAPVNCFLPGGLLRSSISNTLATGPQSIHPAGLQRAFCFPATAAERRAAPLCVPI